MKIELSVKKSPKIGQRRYWWTMGGFSSEFRPDQKGHRNGKVLKWWARRVEK
jgi:hypothetical protein